MHIDDRLATVLRQRAAGERAARTQYRQLLDLLDERHDAAPDDVEEGGWERLSTLSAQIAPADRAAILHGDGWRLRNPALILFLAEQESEVAAAALGAVRLPPEDWALLIPELPLRARGFLRLRRDLPQTALDVLERLGVQDRGLPRPEEQEAQHGEAEAPQTSPEPSGGSDDALDDWAVHPPSEARTTTETDDPGQNLAEAAAPAAVAGQEPSSSTESPIAALVARIDAFQKRRAQAGSGRVPPPAPAPLNVFTEPRTDEPMTEASALQTIDFFTNAAYKIDWAETAVAPMIVGTSLRHLAQWAPLEIGEPFEAALLNHQPIRYVPVELRGAPAITGNWVIKAMPRFDKIGGHFEGYIGRFFRQAEKPAKPTIAEERADRMRQWLHELRTPLNAIQGIAEIIQQQVDGPVPAAYRALAAEIISDSSLLQSGFDDMERLTRLEAVEEGYLAEGMSELDAVLTATIRRLRPTLQAQQAGFDLFIRAARSTVPLQQKDAELLIWRVLGCIAAGAQRGKVLEISLVETEQVVTLSCELPPLLQQADDLFAIEWRQESDTINMGLFGSGFALRLARAEARFVGGRLQRDEGRLLLTLPLILEERESAA